MTKGVPIAFKEVGLRPGQAVRYQLTANASADYQCMTFDSYYGPGGTGPSHAASAQVSAAAEYTAADDGTIAQVLTLPYAPAPAVSCPPGSELGRWRYSFTDVALHDLTNGLSEALPAPGGEA
jgi:hypothetical protein